MPDPTSPQRVTDRITVAGITAVGYHGVFDHERRDGQTFVADVTVHVDTRAAAAHDRLDLTVHYGLLAEQVAAVLSGDPADLVETVAERIAAVALTHPGVHAVDVVVHKPQAPVTVPFADVTVAIHRDREHLPSVAGPPVVVDLTVEGAGTATHPGEPEAEEPWHTSPLPPHPPAPPGPLPAAPVTPDAPFLAAGPHGAPLPGGAATSPEAYAAGALPGPDATAVMDPGAVAAALALPVPEPADSEPVVVHGSGHGSGHGGGHGGAHAARQTTEVDPTTAAPPVDRLDAAPDSPVDVVLALGSNLGASHETLRRAVLDLAAAEGLEVTAVAPLARTSPVGGPDQPDFLNTVVLARTVLSPRALLHTCQHVEQQHGRERHEHWGPRTLDVDVVTYGSLVAGADDLELPHPRAHQRAFVLEPWAQLDPDAVLPGLGGGPVAALAQTAPDREGIRWMALDWWTAPEAGA